MMKVARVILFLLSAFWVSLTAQSWWYTGSPTGWAPMVAMDLVPQYANDENIQPTLYWVHEDRSYFLVRTPFLYPGDSVQLTYTTGVVFRSCTARVNARMAAGKILATGTAEADNKVVVTLPSRHFWRPCVLVTAHRCLNLPYQDRLRVALAERVR